MARLAGARPLLILVNDRQRDTDTRAVLEILRGEFDLAGARMLVAAGTHSFSAQERGRFEKWLAGGRPPAATAWHDCRAADLVPLGPPGAWRGHPWLLEAGGVLAVGSVEPHYFAGFTGAHKTATVGCASHADVEANHARATEASCRPCHLDGNPVFSGVCGLLEALERVRTVAAVNLVQTGGQILHASGGSAIQSLREAVPTATETFCRRLPRPADGIIAEVHGALGASFYQADKGIKNNEWAVRDGGCLVLSAPCPAGIGQDHFMSLLREAPDHEQAAATLRRRGYRLGDHKAVRLRYLTDPRCRGIRLFVVSPGLSSTEAAVLGATKAASVEEAVALAGLTPGRDALYRVRDAGNVCVVVGE
jgi:nickel-dependent lactate racemase